MAEYTCCSSVAFERPNENTFTFTRDVVKGVRVRFFVVVPSDLTVRVRVGGVGGSEGLCFVSLAVGVGSAAVMWSGKWPQGCAGCALWPPSCVCAYVPRECGEAVVRVGATWRGLRCCMVPTPFPPVSLSPCVMPSLGAAGVHVRTPGPLLRQVHVHGRNRGRRGGQ